VRVWTRNTPTRVRTLPAACTKLSTPRLARGRPGRLELCGDNKMDNFHVIILGEPVSGAVRP
jgi:hypothetical protein